MIETNTYWEKKLDLAVKIYNFSPIFRLEKLQVSKTNVAFEKNREILQEKKASSKNY